MLLYLGVLTYLSEFTGFCWKYALLLGSRKEGGRGEGRGRERGVGGDKERRRRREI